MHAWNGVKFIPLTLSQENKGKVSCDESKQDRMLMLKVDKVLMLLLIHFFFRRLLSDHSIQRTWTVRTTSIPSSKQVLQTIPWKRTNPRFLYSTEDGVHLIQGYRLDRGLFTAVALVSERIHVKMI